jgi:hypothetical protein
VCRPTLRWWANLRRRRVCRGRWRVDCRLVRHTHKRTNTHTHTYTHTHTHTDRQTDRQTHYKHTHKHTPLTHRPVSPPPQKQPVALPTVTHQPGDHTGGEERRGRPCHQASPGRTSRDVQAREAGGVSAGGLGMVPHTHAHAKAHTGAAI